LENDVLRRCFLSLNGLSQIFVSPPINKTVKGYLRQRLPNGCCGRIAEMTPPSDRDDDGGIKPSIASFWLLAAEVPVFVLRRRSAFIFLFPCSARAEDERKRWLFIQFE
jgi:hypothetical protein